MRVNRFGNDEPPISLANWPIFRLVGGHFAGRQAAFLGLSNNTKRELFAVGLSDALKETWNYPLPAGAHRKPIEAITLEPDLIGPSRRMVAGGA